MHRQGIFGGTYQQETNDSDSIYCQQQIHMAYQSATHHISTPSYREAQSLLQEMKELNYFMHNLLANDKNLDHTFNENVLNGNDVILKLFHMNSLVYQKLYKIHSTQQSFQIYEILNGLAKANAIGHNWWIRKNIREEQNRNSKKQIIPTPIKSAPSFSQLRFSEKDKQIFQCTFQSLHKLEESLKDYKDLSSNKLVQKYFKAKNDHKAIVSIYEKELFSLNNQLQNYQRLKIPINTKIQSLKENLNLIKQYIQDQEAYPIENARSSKSKISFSQQMHKSLPIINKAEFYRGRQIFQQTIKSLSGLLSSLKNFEILRLQELKQKCQTVKKEYKLILERYNTARQSLSESEKNTSNQLNKLIRKKSDEVKEEINNLQNFMKKKEAHHNSSFQRTKLQSRQRSRQRSRSRAGSKAIIYRFRQLGEQK